MYIDDLHDRLPYRIPKKRSNFMTFINQHNKPIRSQKIEFGSTKKNFKTIFQFSFLTKDPWLAIILAIILLK